MNSRPLPRPPAVRVSELGFGAAQGGNLYRATTDDEFQPAVPAQWISALNGAIILVALVVSRITSGKAQE